MFAPKRVNTTISSILHPVLTVTRKIQHNISPYVFVCHEDATGVSSAEPGEAREMNERITWQSQEKKIKDYLAKPGKEKGKQT